MLRYETNLTDFILSENIKHTKNVLYDFIYIKFLNQLNLLYSDRNQNSGQWGAIGSYWTLKGHEGTFWHTGSKYPVSWYHCGYTSAFMPINI